MLKSSSVLAIDSPDVLGGTRAWAARGVGVGVGLHRHRERISVVGAAGFDPLRHQRSQISDALKLSASTSASVVPLAIHVADHTQGASDMASEQDGKHLSNRGNETASDYGVRAGQAIERLVPGPNRDKEIARIFKITDRMARFLRRGQFWTIERLNQASLSIPGFDTYVADPLLARCDELEREIADIRDMLRGKEHG